MTPAVRQNGASLRRSFAAVCALLERPKAARRAVVMLLAVHTILLGYSAYVHSPTLNEPGHLVAGLSYWKFGRFDVYSVNPPLVKLVAALPVMAFGYEGDWSGIGTSLGERPEIRLGRAFVAANGERSHLLFTVARWACIPFSWVGGIVCYLWARDLYGRPAGIIACFLWCFEPNTLAHASLLTPDAHATSLGLAACYTFWKWLKKPTWSQAMLTGVVLGLAELAKTTLIIFYPLWPVLWLLYRWPDRRGMLACDWLREAGMLLMRMAIGLYVLNLGYMFEDSLRPLGDYKFVSELFTGEELEKSCEHTAASTSGPSVETPLLVRTRNRFSSSWIGALPVPFPANYIVGIDLQQRDFEDYGRPSYLGGVWRNGGWWYYYIYACAIKMPLGLWMLAALAIISAIPLIFCGALPRWPCLSRDEWILLAPPAVVFIVVSMKTGFSEHMRYVLPCFPFAYVWVSRSIKIVDGTINKSLDYCSFQRLLLVGAIVWVGASSIWIYPHSLSYFNEAVGGPLGGGKHLLGSNIDWGQDLLYFKRWQEATIKPSVLCSFTSYEPSDLGIELLSNKANSPIAFDMPTRCFGVMSVNHLYGHRDHALGNYFSLADGLDEFVGQFGSCDLEATIGYSMGVFRCGSGDPVQQMQTHR